MLGSVAAHGPWVPWTQMGKVPKDLHPLYDQRLTTQRQNRRENQRSLTIVHKPPDKSTSVFLSHMPIEVSHNHPSQGISRSCHPSTSRISPCLVYIYLGADALITFNHLFTSRKFSDDSSHFYSISFFHLHHDHSKKALTPFPIYRSISFLSLKYRIFTFLVSIMSVNSLVLPVKISTYKSFTAVPLVPFLSVCKHDFLLSSHQQ